MNEEYEIQRMNFYNSLPAKGKEDGSFTCKICKDKGFVDTLEPNLFGDMVNHVLRECRCRRKTKILNVAERSGLDSLLRVCTFERFETLEAWQKQIKDGAQAFCNDESARCFYIGGQVGCGKTHICTAIFGNFIKKGYKALYMKWDEESRKLKAVTNDLRYSEMVKKFKEAPVLYIDDFFKVQNGGVPTEADVKLAFNIINERYMDNNKITIISSEKNFKELMKYDEATMSRIYQMAGKYQWSIEKDPSKNYRMKGIRH